MLMEATVPSFCGELVGLERRTLTSPSLFSWLSVSAVSHTRDLLPGLKGGDRRAAAERWAGIALQECTQVQRSWGGLCLACSEAARSRGLVGHEISTVTARTWGALLCASLSWRNRVAALKGQQNSGSERALQGTGSWLHRLSRVI